MTDSELHGLIDVTYLQNPRHYDLMHVLGNVYTNM